jgi:malate dehydrogenase
VLDTCRFRYFIAEELGALPSDVSAMVLGGHGDSMVPLPRYTTVSGVPVTRLIAPDKLEAMVARARNGGGEIVALLKTGSAFYAPAASAAEMVEAVLLDSKRVMPCSVYLNGQYGIEDVYIGVPVKLGKDGVEQVYELKLDPAELQALQTSAEAVRTDVKALAQLL